MIGLPSRMTTNPDFCKALAASRGPGPGSFGLTSDCHFFLHDMDTEPLLDLGLRGEVLADGDADMVKRLGPGGSL